MSTTKPAILSAAEIEAIRASLAGHIGSLGKRRMIERLLGHIDALRGRIETALNVIGENGDDCDHAADEHDDTCDRCLACRIEAALKGETV